MTDLMELASRVEAGEGPDRDLDALIAPLQGLRVVDEGHSLGRCCYDVNRCVVRLPAYTASLDAAMTLLPAAYDHIEVYPPRGKYTGWTVHIIPPSRAMFDTCTGYAPSYERALTAAALRARAHQGTAHVEQ